MNRNFGEEKFLFRAEPKSIERREKRKIEAFSGGAGDASERDRTFSVG